ncbi:MAG TPA: phosphate ABC transporter substrate-binding protein [Blastocatellia bacterium]|nr:phosphate ABC transporter substrate-binding protein [Blastocatellia bacterium]
MTRSIRFALGLIAFAALSLAFAGCANRSPESKDGSGAAGKNSRAITVKGSDTMVILGQRWAEEYMKANPGTMVQVTGGGSGTGIAALLNGTTDIAESSRPMKEQERADFKAKYGKDIVEVRVALDGLGVYVNQANPLKEIAIPQVRDIYLGKITDWKDVGGAPGRIVLYGRENNSGTYEYFKEHVLEKQDFAAKTQTLSGTAAVINAVGQDKNAIGYGGIAYAKEVKVLAIKKDPSSPAIAPEMANVENGTYPISRYLYWYLPGEPTGETKKLVDWVESSTGQGVVKDVGYFPIR